MRSENKEEIAADNTDAASPPPIFGSWRNLYLLVIGNLAFMVIMFYLFTLAYR